jgi:hypothetical protein
MKRAALRPANLHRPTWTQQQLLSRVHGEGLSVRLVLECWGHRYLACLCCTHPTLLWVVSAFGNASCCLPCLRCVFLASAQLVMRQQMMLQQQLLMAQQQAAVLQAQQVMSKARPAGGVSAAAYVCLQESGFCWLVDCSFCLYSQQYTSTATKSPITIMWSAACYVAGFMAARHVAWESKAADCLDERDLEPPLRALLLLTDSTLVPSSVCWFKHASRQTSAAAHARTFQTV